MTADEARALTKGLQDKLQLYIDAIDEDIREAAIKGSRHVNKSYGGSDYNNDLMNYYIKQGFKVSHITSPFDELEIHW